MKKLNKGLALILAVVMVVCLVLSGCGDQKPTEATKDTASPDTATQAATEAPTQAETEAATEAPSKDPVKSTDDPAMKALLSLQVRHALTRTDYDDQVPVMIASYDTDAKELKQAAFTYDNALTAMAFISADCQNDAMILLDSFVYAINHDRFRDGLARNAYASGNIINIVSGKNGDEIVRLPGWYTNGWKEDAYQVGCNVGNTSYLALAMLHYDDVYGANRYTDHAMKLMDWVINECSDSGDGFKAGWNGWPENGKATVLKYKSTEHNIDAYAAFKRLYEVTGEQRYGDAADSALRFIKSMYSYEDGCFCTGTKDDGVTPDTGVTVLDTQVWSALALADEFAPYSAALDTVAAMKTEEGAYPFCKDNKNGGFWCEGTAFTALMYSLTGEDKLADEAIEALIKVQLESGLFPAATVDDLTTGMYLDDGSPWEYKSYPHIAPTAWFVMQSKGFNPYTFD